jgi:hypothetical protein
MNSLVLAITLGRNVDRDASRVAAVGAPPGAALAAVASTSARALCLGFAFGPSRRTTSPLLRPLLTPAG